MSTRSIRGLLLGSVTLNALIAGAAFAQATGADQLQEVVVTATRQASTVNRVPLSVSAVTQQTLDQEGVKNVSDLQRVVPALQFTTDSGGAGNFTIRGIVATTGAPTTGVYLDDTPLQQRRVVSGAAAINGTPTPRLFDLERVEVLRGPQGTLYGGSSEGGTVRFITTAPSLTTYSGVARAELSQVDSGGTGHEVGLAFGGPIVKDKLGFRLSLYDKHTAGYVDIVDPYNNGAIKYKDANSHDSTAIHASLVWAISDTTKATFSLYNSIVRDKGGPDQWLAPQPAGKTYTTPATCYDTRVAGVAGALPPRTTCPTGALPSYIYQRPSYTYGPFNYLNTPYQSFQQRLFPARTPSTVGSVTLEQDVGSVTLKSITSYVEDSNRVTTGTNSELQNQQVTTDYPGATGFSLYGPNPQFDRAVLGNSLRSGLVEELRASSSSNATPLSWVAGLYYSKFRERAVYAQVPYGITTLSWLASNIFGRPTVQAAFGAPDSSSFATRDQHTVDQEFAAFGEFNYNVTSKFKIIAGLRWSEVKFQWQQIYYGTLNGWSDPYSNPQGVVNGNTTDKPLTPKLGAQYQLSSNDMLYATASKGYRAGGVNTIVLQNLCGPTLANLGLTVNDVPKSYSADSIWSYEAGGKFRLFDGRVQLNSSAFRNDWSNLQLTVPNLGGGCGGGWVQNGGKARSQGFDVDLQAKPMRNLTIYGTAGYTDAKYITPVSLPTPLNGAAPTLIVRKGDPLPVTPWQVSLGARYDFPLTALLRAYVRGDYTYAAGFLRGTPPGVTGYAADTAYADASSIVNFRAGVVVNGWDVNVFANNAFNSKDIQSRGSGRTGCAVATGAACTTFTGYDPFLTVSEGRPREVGVQANYRF